MKKIILNFYITALIALFITLPYIPARTLMASKPEPTPSVILKEDSLPAFAKFKAYDENIEADSFTITVAKGEKKPEPTKAPVTPAVQSIAVSIEDIQPTATPQPQSEAGINLAESPQSLNQEQIQFLGSCEAGMDPTKNTGNGYYGAFQFSYGTWQSMNTGYERADLAPLEVQIDAVQRLLQRSSIYTQFPACARKMASQGLI